MAPPSPAHLNDIIAPPSVTPLQIAGDTVNHDLSPLEIIETGGGTGGGAGKKKRVGLRELKNIVRRNCTRCIGRTS